MPIGKYIKQKLVRVGVRIASNVQVNRQLRGFKNHIRKRKRVQLCGGDGHGHWKGYGRARLRERDPECRPSAGVGDPRALPSPWRSGGAASLKPGFGMRARPWTAPHQPPALT